MTWGEFKKHVEERGVTDDLEINWIDVTRPYAPSVTVDIEGGEFKVSE